jgi:hypothetical protein
MKLKGPRLRLGGAPMSLMGPRLKLGGAPTKPGSAPYRFVQYRMRVRMLVSSAATAFFTSLATS